MDRVLRRLLKLLSRDGLAGGEARQKHVRRQSQNPGDKWQTLRKVNRSVQVDVVWW